MSEGAAIMNSRPNIILCMTDDQGWGDTGYNGNPVAKTPHLDAMAKEGLRFDRFYSAAPVCSPTRASCLTGRNPYRMGVFHANQGILRPEEFTLMELLKNKGYTTGHFGKWHLGTLTAAEKDSNRGRPDNNPEYNPPWEHGFDVCFSTEAKVPTWDPMKKPLNASRIGWKALGPNDASLPYGTFYWNEKGQKVTDNLDGCDSRVIMDRTLPFIQDAAESETPFFAVVWFHAPHLPCVARPKLFDHYKAKGLTDDAANFYGSISGVDEQMGRLREKLKALGIEDNTMLWYCSDNGPEGKASPNTGTAGPYRGRKRDLYEGGVRVPGLLVWPGQIKTGRITDVPCVTSDYLPTIMDWFGESCDERPLDGVSLLPLIQGKPFERKKTIGFKFQSRYAWNQDRYKLYADKWGQDVELYDLQEDPGEKCNLADEKPELLERLQAEYGGWESSVKDSFEGKEYGRVSFDRLKQKWPEDGNKKNRRERKSRPLKGRDMESRMTKPNILFVLLDDLGKEWISCYGATDVETPNIDTLAEGGMRCENVYSMPQCTPSRVCLLTGQYPYRNGWVNHWDVPRWGAGARYDVEAYPCNLGLTMREAGYATAIAGKWQINDFRVEPDALEKAGFDDWCMWTGGEGGNPASNERYWDPYIFTKDKPSQTYQGAFGPDIFCDFVIDFARKQKDAGRPFFVYYPMVLTHTPFTTTPHEPDAKGKEGKHKAMVRYTDFLLGRITAALDEMGVREDTLLIFTSDNGTCGKIVGHIGERTIPGGKAKTIEPGVNIPFIANWPGTIPAGRVSEALVDFTDIIPTCAALAGQEVPGNDKVDGSSLAAYLRGETDHVERDWILAMGGQNRARVSDAGVENEWCFRDRVVRDERYKLYVGTDRKPQKLIDLQADPDEKRDITGSEDEAALTSRAKFEALIPQWPERDADPIYTPQPPQDWDKPVTVKSIEWKKGQP